MKFATKVFSLSSPIVARPFVDPVIPTEGRLRETTREHRIEAGPLLCRLPLLRAATRSRAHSRSEFLAYVLKTSSLVGRRPARAARNHPRQSWKARAPRATRKLSRQS